MLFLENARFYDQQGFREDNRDEEIRQQRKLCQDLDDHHFEHQKRY